MFAEYHNRTLPQFAWAHGKTWLHRIFAGPQGLRAGWGCATFVLFTLGLTMLFEFLVRPLQHALNSLSADSHTPALVALDCSVQWIAALIATWFMARFEKRPIEAYGFDRERFAQFYWRGAVIGICGLSVLLFTIYLTGGWRIDRICLHGSAAWVYGLEWALAFALAGLAEETQMHGYLLASLSRGVTRWPAAIGLSVAFAALHIGNPGETYAGIFFAASASLAFSYMIWKTKSLALVFGLHAAWDWGESFLYGTPDSGQHFIGYLLQTHSSGPPLLSGGSAGPEGSLIGLPVLLLMVIAVQVFGAGRPVYLGGLATTQPRGLADTGALQQNKL